MIKDAWRKNMKKELAQIITCYTDKNGNFSYDLMNKEFISFAHRSKVVRKMIDSKTDTEEIVFYIAANKFRNIVNDHQLSDEDIQDIIVELDDLYTKSIFKELEKEIRKMSHVDKR